MIHLQNLKRLAEDQHVVLQAVMLVLATWDKNLFAHCEQVANELIRLAPADSAAEWYWAGLLHDLGKIALAPEILRKRGALTTRERKAMHKHPTKGAALLAMMHAPQVVVQGTKFHHERWDGTGYPSGLHRQQIPLVARVLAVADVYTALTSDRLYRSAYTPEQARLEIERNAGTQFDPSIVARFFERESHVTR
ncbi:Cyclic di-GMP phosphodiesterase [Anaerolineae bacterium]|nr:Cyclic di-GMP phosphodiesterase [Anaerolineae bacterium]